MKPVSDVVAAIGRTPLIKLRAASEATGCTILGKAEFMNPGGSVKDRAAMAIINDAVARGALRPGGVIVEGTAGNTGIGIAMVASALGYRAVIVIPDTQAQEKKDMLRLAGAELIEVPAVPYSNPNNYVRYSGRLAEALAKTEPNGAVWANQFDNVANRRGHYETTGPEIYDDLNGEVDGFVSAVGTRRNPGRRRHGAERAQPEHQDRARRPVGRGALFVLHDRANSRARAPPSPRALARAGSPPIWKARRSISPTRSPTRRRCRSCSIWSFRKGCCSAAPRASTSPARIHLARELGPGHTIVTLLCDSGARYASKLFNPAFLRSKNLPVPDWLEAKGGAPKVFVQ